MRAGRSKMRAVADLVHGRKPAPGLLDGPVGRQARHQVPEGLPVPFTRSVSEVLAEPLDIRRSVLGEDDFLGPGKH